MVSLRPLLLYVEVYFVEDGFFFNGLGLSSGQLFEEVHFCPFLTVLFGGKGFGLVQFLLLVSFNQLLVSFIGVFPFFFERVQVCLELAFFGELFLEQVIYFGQQFIAVHAVHSLL